MRYGCFVKGDVGGVYRTQANSCWPPNFHLDSVTFALHEQVAPLIAEAAISVKFKPVLMLPNFPVDTIQPLALSKSVEMMSVPLEDAMPINICYCMKVELLTVRGYSLPQIYQGDERRWVISRRIQNGWRLQYSLRLTSICHALGISIDIDIDQSQSVQDMLYR